jgi:hypothetical protein
MQNNVERLTITSKHRRRVFRSALLALVLAIPACGGGTSGDDDGSGGGGGVDAALPPTRTLVADWLYKLPIGDDEIVMTSTSSGAAQLYWYDSGQSHWQVSASDNGAGSAMLTLSCTSADCATADPIVYSCAYTFEELTCMGVSGGYQDNYAGDMLSLTKQGT